MVAAKPTGIRSSRRSRGGNSLPSVAGTDTLILPIHFPTPTVGLITADGDRFDYRFKRD